MSDLNNIEVADLLSEWLHTKAFEANFYAWLICTQSEIPQIRPQHPSGRVGKPEDIARMCLFLCQEENDFINGENITIDGGMTKKMIYIE